MAWYRAGTIAVTNGSTSVVGTSTQWIANVNIGEGLLGPDGRIYEVAAIASNTSITLATAYLGSTASGQAYAIAPTQSYIRDLAAEVAALVTDYGTLADGAVRFETAQSLTTEQATQARDNIGFVAAVRASVLTGLTTVSSAAIAATDTVIGAFQKLQAQITANLSTLTGHTGNTSNPHSVTKAQVGLGSVDNTSDANKPISTATQTALDAKFDKSGGTISGPTQFNDHATVNNGKRVYFYDPGSSTWMSVHSPSAGALQVASASGYVAEFNSQGLDVAQGATFGGNVGIGGAPASAPLVVRGTTNGNLWVRAASATATGLTGVGLSGINNAGSALSDVAIQGANIHMVVDNTVVGKFSSGGNWLVGTTSGSHNTIQKNVTADAGIAVLEIAGSSGATIGAFFGVSAYGANSANTACILGKDAVTGRSINAGGTINASGADWAEYRKNNGLKIAKGQIVGYKGDGTLTLTWSEATMARVKTTNPTMVGGDTWGTEAEIGKLPGEPQFKAPEYTGRTKPEDLRPEPQAPEPLARTEPEHPGEDADAVAAATYALALRDFQAAVKAHGERQAAYTEALSKWQADAAQHELSTEEWNTDQVEYKARCDVERNLFDTVTYPEYLRAKAAFDERLEAARQTVDRIAYSGIVPCNVQGATPGHYIVAAEGPNDTIVGLSVRRPTEEQWGWVVGRCLRVLPDGRAEIDVMLS